MAIVTLKFCATIKGLFIGIFMKEKSEVELIPKLADVLNRLTVDQLRKLLKFIKGAPKKLTKKRDFLTFFKNFVLSANNVEHQLKDLKNLDRKALAETLHNYGGIFDSDAFSAKYGSKPYGVRGGFDSWGSSGAKPINLFLFPWVDILTYLLTGRWALECLRFE